MVIATHCAMMATHHTIIATHHATMATPTPTLCNDPNPDTTCGTTTVAVTPYAV
jgi:hypothetical protein